jgi:transcriptional regulator with XRE-family HTH domain
MQTIGDQIRTIREALGMTQTQLAERSGLTQSMIAGIETGERDNPSFATVNKLAEGLNCSFVSQLSPKKDIPVFRGTAKLCNVETKKCIKVKTGFGLDTGANVSFTSERSIPVLKEKLGEFKSGTVTVGTPTGPSNLIRTESIMLCVKKSCAKGLSFIPALLPVDIMLGSDFLRANKCKIDFEGTSLICNNRKIKFT